jgi:hypothetical protein
MEKDLLKIYNLNELNILNKYLKINQIQDIDEISIVFGENEFLRYLMILPKSIYRNYFLILKINQKEERVKITYKEKELFKSNIHNINKKIKNYKDSLN